MSVLLAILCLLCIRESVTVEQQPQEGLLIFLTCWYNTYDAGVRHRNAVLGYNNSLPTPINATPGSPGVFNELLADGNLVSGVISLFLPGFFPTAFVVERVNLLEWEVNVSNSNASVFALLNLILSAEPNSTMCWEKFQHSCAIVNNSQVPIPRFCEDGSFCDGLEFCDSNNMCQHNGSELCVPCNEEPPFCGFTPSPTGAPTFPPTPFPTTPAPTNAPTAIITSAAPTSSPTSLAPTSAPTAMSTTVSPTSTPTEVPTSEEPTPEPTTPPPTPAPEDPGFAIAILVSIMIVLVILVLCCFVRQKQNGYGKRTTDCSV